MAEHRNAACAEKRPWLRAPIFISQVSGWIAPRVDGNQRAGIYRVTSSAGSRRSPALPFHVVRKCSGPTVETRRVRMPPSPGKTERRTWRPPGCWVDIFCGESQISESLPDPPRAETGWGKSRVKRVAPWFPLPILLVTSTSPPCRRMIVLTMAKPNPAPPACRARLSSTR